MIENYKLLDFYVDKLKISPTKIIFINRPYAEKDFEQLNKFKSVKDDQFRIYYNSKINKLKIFTTKQEINIRLFGKIDYWKINLFVNNLLKF